ncbi:hypothetical protein EPN90_02030 [Patescibacteria group bacterium]|nr:MAG: hypothetical protein EPN90_02030 [Patescibacteria group bacterium]
MRRGRLKNQLVTTFLTALSLAGVFFVIPAIVSAQAVNVGLAPIEGVIALGTADIRVIVARILRNLFALLGIVAVVIILYGGFLWMSSQGEEETINKAKRVLINGVIGLAIILSALAITQFILNSLLLATTGVGLPGGPGGGAPVPKSGSLGQGIIESHYPERGATNVPRNTKIVITFKVEMDLASLSNNFKSDDPKPCDEHDLNAANVKVYRSEQGPTKALTSEEVGIACTPDKKTFVLRPRQFLGSATENVAYIVDLAGGVGGLKKIVGGVSQPAFDGAFAAGYQWDFTTGTFIDTTPPQVEAVYPVNGSRGNPRNTIVQINFSEPVDPTTVTGKLPGFQNLRITVGTSTADVAGGFSVGNRYRTVEFLPGELCGKNACGEDVFCLPGAVDLAARARAATLSGEPPSSIIPPDGVTDMAGNSLDGNKNGKAEGPAQGDQVKDDYPWSFSTSNEIDLVSPKLEKTTPGVDQPMVAPDKPLEGSFSKVMSFTSFTTQAVLLAMATSTAAEPVCFTTAGSHLYPPDPKGNPDLNASPQKSALIINHCLFLPDTNYVPTITQAVRDIRQNCYYPGVNEALNTCSEKAMQGYSYCCNGTPCKNQCVVKPPGVVPICL